ncbi:MAG TPA: phosphoglycerate kinase [Dehalococcoidia bacterium]|nr:phosphoglycerate kinase [Dehalococcoidia bacterium]
MIKKTVKDVDVGGKRVLVRVDFNVPLAQDGTISDDTRIQACLPTINYLVAQRARVILCSHLGRPKGRVAEELRLAPVARRLSQLLGQPVAVARDCVGPEAEAAAAQLKDGEVLLLENLRFHPEEEANDPGFAQALARLADLFVNDAFGASHRAHASVVGVAEQLPAVAGLLMEKELEALGKAVEDPARPLAAIIGGAKVSDKIGVLENILDRIDALLIGGGMAATFLKAEGYEVGASAVEEDRLEPIKGLIHRARCRGVRLLLPSDVTVAERLEAGAPAKTVSVAEVPPGWLIADIGPTTLAQFAQELRRCGTVLWNGPMGVFEMPQFARGTRDLVKVLAGLKATTIIGGGSTVEAVTEMGLAPKMSHVSTGGGASLEFLEGKVLPGVAVLENREP